MKKFAVDGNLKLFITTYIEELTDSDAAEKFYEKFDEEVLGQVIKASFELADGRVVHIPLTLGVEINEEEVKVREAEPDELDNFSDERKKSLISPKNK